MIPIKKGPYSFNDFLEIMRDLRSENGCAWDKVQTLESLRPCMMEEAAEYLDSYRIYQETGDPENMKEELGDLLLQVVMNSQIAEAENLFTFEDVVEEVSEKMIRRHPHVFEEEQGQTDTPEKVLATWEDIKKKEKEGKNWVDTPLREIPRTLPSLTRATKVLKKKDKLYEQGRSLRSNIAIMEELLTQMKMLAADMEMNQDSMKRDRADTTGTDTDFLENMVGEMLMCLADIGRECRLSEEQILTDKIDTLIATFEPRKNA
ncbi:MAG: MazG family protein [Lachnospiraceae bacterium]|nr:MazG family protein [Lachnospiraceae bacterium]